MHCDLMSNMTYVSWKKDSVKWALQPGRWCAIMARKWKDSDFMLWNRQEYIDLMTFGEARRPMFVELFGPLVGLEQEWREQGASRRELSLDAFDFDYIERVEPGCNTGVLGGFEPCVLEDTPEYRISRDELGRIMKLPKKTATLPLPLDYAVKDDKDWEKIRHFYAYSDQRIDREKLIMAKKRQEGGALVTCDIPGGFDLPRELMGEEAACLCYYENPELMRDILQTAGEMLYRVLDTVTDVVTIDNLLIHEDLAGKSGPMVGPVQVEEYIKPYYQKIISLLKEKGTKIFSQDSDGFIEPVMDSFINCGVNVFFPMEPQAGMDVVKMRKKYGETIAFKGGIDKMALRRDKTAIFKELEYKLQDCLKKGMAFGLDHRIPNGVSLENYRYYVDTAREMLGMSPRDTQNGRHVRMAF